MFGFFFGFTLGVTLGLLCTSSVFFRETLLLQLIALLCHSLTITVIAKSAECSCSLYILLLLHQVVSIGVSGTVDGLDLVVAGLQALGSLLVACDSRQAALYSLHICHSTSSTQRLHGFIILLLQTVLLITFLDRFVVALQRSLKLFIRKAQCLGVVSAAFNGLGLILQVAFLSDLQFGHQLADISPGILEVLIQRLLAEIIGFFPLAILQRHESTAKQRLHIGFHRGIHDDGRHGLLSCSRLIIPGNLLDAPDQILHEAQFAHILRL